ncbi:hypothetical protein L1987_64436 [Smallanthus sonchifolius]|uniref:Uncharacterized protein n=1 Tax=Smallanthus sonchifolius TaxID=185202 RepID=A0ACB9CG00_9ASTR|nr:hypothetical protein L1987_64436 [Smallanthus sonchifolius]
MINRLLLKGIKRSNREEKEQRKNRIGQKEFQRRGQKDQSNDSDDDQTPLSLLLKKKKDLDSDFKEVQVEDKEMDTDIANAETEMKVVATVEVQNTTLAEKTNKGAKEIDSVLNEIDDAFKLSEIELGEKDADGTSGMEESMDEESENNKEKYISPKGKFKRLSKVVVDEDKGNIGYSMGDEIEVLEKLLDVLHKQKNLFDSKLGRLLENHQEQQEVLELKEKIQPWASKTNQQIQSVLEDLANNSTSNDGNVSENDNYGDNEKNDKEETNKEGENDTSADKEDENDTSADSGDNGVVDHDQQQPEDTEENTGEENDNVQANAGWKNDAEKGLGESVESDAVTISLEHSEIFEIKVSKDTAKEGNTEEEKTNEIVYDAPPFSIGLTQLESNNEELDTGKEKVDSQQGLSVTKEADGSTLHQNKSEYVYDGLPFSIGLTQLESHHGADETKQIEESNMEKRSDEVESSDIRGWFRR